MIAILVVYGTTDGHTAKIAHFLAETLTRAGARAEVARAGPGYSPDPAGYDAVMVAASLHAGGYQREVRRWLRHHAPKMIGVPTAFISVCLGILQHDPGVWAELDAKVDRLLRKTGWEPTVVKIVAGAIPYSRYGWLKRRVMQSITRKAGVITDPSRDYDYTEWEDLRSFAMGFLRRADDGEPAGCGCEGGVCRPMSASA